MTLLLEKAFTEAKKLGEDEQDALASVIIDEILAERKWDESFAKTQDTLERLADEALDDIALGKVSPMRFN